MSFAPGKPLQRAAWGSGLILVLASACRAPAALGARPVLAGESAVADSSEPLEVRVWRAGRLVPPGISAARELELASARALAQARLEPDLGRSGEARLAAWLGDLETPDELWGAAARAAAALERYALAPLLAEALEPTAGAHKNVVARSALHELYGRWFRRVDEVEPYLECVRAGAGTRLLLESCRWEEARSRERLLAELAHEPSSAAAWLADPDPRVRSGAARVLAQVFRQQSGDSAGTLGTLVTHLEGEFEPSAFHDGLEACLEPLERAAADEPASLRLRALLVEIARTPGDPRSLSAAQALGRVPWRVQGPRDLAYLFTGIDALGAMLRGLAAADERRGVNDPDPLVAVLAGLRQLSAQASSAGLTRELRASPVRESLFALAANPAQDDGVRAAAAAALGPMVGAGDAPKLAAILGDARVGAGVKHALLGALIGILPGLDPGASGASDLLAAVATLTGDPDADLRRRALALCAEPTLEPLVRLLDPSFLVERLAREDGREATLRLLDLIGRFGRPEMLDSMLALERFDALCAEPVTQDALAGVLRSLAGSSGAASLRAALRLAEARGEETQLARLRHALALVAALDDSAAFELAPSAQRAVCAWVWRVVGAGVAPRDLVPSGLAFEQRLLDIHLPRGEAREGGEGNGLGAFERAHLAALLRSDLFLGGTGGAAPTQRGSKQEVEAAFESAHALAPAPEQRLLVLRDRARFRAAANECVKAMSDYRRLLEASGAGESLLGIPDLRSAVEMLGRLDEPGGKGRSPTAGEACELLRQIIARRGWRSEPASVRMQDLRDWARTALDSGEIARLRQVEAALADLPLTQLETQAEREPPPLWFGLTREAGWFQDLLDLRARVRLGVRALEAQG